MPHSWNRRSAFHPVRVLLQTGAWFSAAAGCASPDHVRATDAAIAEQHTTARSKDGAYISWTEHLIDGQAVNGGVRLRGGDGLKMADMDNDGHIDIISVHEDSDHLRIAFGGADVHDWTHVTVASGEPVDAIEDVAIGDFNNDGWADIVAACERGHVAYFQNPGQAVRTAPWRATIPTVTRARGSWLRVSASDVDGDGQLEIIAANKGGVDYVTAGAGDKNRGALSILEINGDPADPDAWTETPLWTSGVPNTAFPVDIEKDGDIDVLTGSRLAYEAVLLLQAEPDHPDTVQWRTQVVEIAPGPDMPAGWRGATNVFHAASADLDCDGRTDLILTAVEQRAEGVAVSIGWLQQPRRLSGAWTYFPIGDAMPDVIAGFALADIDGDGDLDIMTGGYSGLNVLDGGYSGAARDHDDPAVTPSSSVGRIAWFENTGDPGSTWLRHDISRRVRGMFDEFVAHDMDGDGDVDFVGTRGNSAEHDGVFWLEQVRTTAPRRVFHPAKEQESRQMSPPPPNWRAVYDRNTVFIAPENN